MKNGNKCFRMEKKAKWYQRELQLSMHVGRSLKRIIEDRYQQVEVERWINMVKQSAMQR